MAMNQKKAHHYPQMTVEALARYVTTTNPSSRRVILRQEKYYDSVTQPPYYREIRRSLLRHVSDPDREDTALLDAANRILVPQNAKDYERERLSNNVLGLKKLHACRDQFILTDVLYDKPHTSGHSTLAGVKVISSPVAAVEGRWRNLAHTGCLKLYLGKSKPLDPEQAAYIGAALIRFLEVSILTDRPHHKFVTIVDVFRSRTYSAPSATTRRIATLEDACRDIAGIWGTI